MGRHVALVLCFAVAAVVGFEAGQPARALPADLAELQLRVGLARPGGGYSVTSMRLETYVGHVLAGEAARESSSAAFEALAIAIRTFAVANLGRHRADDFDLCDQTHCQVVRTATAVTERAAASTAGRILVREGSPASIFYSASCGGRTEIPSAVWPGAEDPPYLPSQSDDACRGMPEWTADLDASDLLRAFRSAGFRGGRLRDLRVIGHDVSGRVSRLRVDGLTPDTLSGQDLRVAVGRTLGWQLIKSTAFELTRRGNVYSFVGHGSGHGVGMCVIGSVRLAAAGESAEAILARYYPGLEITAPAAGGVASLPAARTASARASPGGPEVLVSLPDEGEADERALANLAAGARDALARTLGEPVPARVTIRVHPTTASYERATGQAWFTSGALVGRELHLLPLAGLRDRGVLEQTIRRELVHLLADQALAARPLWVRQGAALYFSEPATAAGASRRERGPRVSCPNDAEIRRPVSVGAMSTAWARARACFTAQVAAGRTWREVR